MLSSSSTTRTVFVTPPGSARAIPAVSNMFPTGRPRFVAALTRASGRGPSGDPAVARRGGRLQRLDGDRGQLAPEEEGEGAAPAGRAVHLDAAAVGAHHVLHDGEADAGALLLPRQEVVDAVELLEDPLVLVAGDPLAVVAHGDGHL